MVRYRSRVRKPYLRIKLFCHYSRPTTPLPRGEEEQVPILPYTRAVPPKQYVVGQVGKFYRTKVYLKVLVWDERDSTTSTI